MTKSMQRIEEALARLEVLGSRLSVVFSVAFLLACIVVVFCLALELANFLGSGESPEPVRLVQLASALLDFVVYGAMLLVMRSIAKDVAQGRSPFTIAHARQIKILAWLFLAGFVLSIFASSGFISVADFGEFHIGVASDHLTDYPVFSVDAKSVVGAIVCFSLSSVWKYGALLQADSDDYL